MTTPPDDLAGALNFTAQRFVAAACELDKARAKLLAVEELIDNEPGDENEGRISKAMLRAALGQDAT